MKVLHIQGVKLLIHIIIKISVILYYGFHLSFRTGKLGTKFRNFKIITLLFPLIFLIRTGTNKIFLND